jgi:hypothetical protein
MTPKDEKNLAEVIEKIASQPEPQRSLMQHVHELIMAAGPSLKPRIWYGMPAYAASASTPALVTLRNDERLNLALTEKVALQPSDGSLMPAAWYFDEIDGSAEQRIAEIVRTALA